MESNKLYNKNWYEANNGVLSPLPEKVLQFGTGVLLRGLPDYFINKFEIIPKIFKESCYVVVTSEDNNWVSDYENLYNYLALKGKLKQT